MSKFTVSLCAIALLAVAGTAHAADCPGNPNAIGISRTIAVDPAEHPRLGTMQYKETLPLNDHEVVLTFDDGPLPPYTNRVLQTLEAECVKATFFIVGEQAKANPAMVRRIYNEGHTIGTHSQTHPLHLNRMSASRGDQEIDEGIASVKAALGDPKALAPFFRVPGLNGSAAIDEHLRALNIATWSADFPADDWKHIGAAEVMHRALSRLEAKGRGILLLHDIQPATALALPWLLKGLKKRGYHIVHVVPATPDRPKTVTEPDQWVMHHEKQGWPRVAAGPQMPGPNPESFGLMQPYSPAMTAPVALLAELAHANDSIAIMLETEWPSSEPEVAAGDATELASPAVQSFGIDEPSAPENVVLLTSATGQFAPTPAPRVMTARAIRHASHHPRMLRMRTLSPRADADPGFKHWDELAPPRLRTAVR